MKLKLSSEKDRYPQPKGALGIKSRKSCGSSRYAATANPSEKLKPSARITELTIELRIPISKEALKK